jgi:endoglucanase
VNTKQPVILAVVSLSFMSQVSLQASDDHSSTRSVPPPAHTTVDLSRGISIDRQFRTIPPKPIMRITREDIQLIKSMGFEFVKLIINPEPLMSGNRLNESKWYLKEIVQRVVEEGLPVVVCIHPEWEFKKALLSDPGEFARLLGFIEDVGKFLARGWGPKEVVLQLMTEPGANAMDWNDLQPRLWRAARRAMPEHTLILAGDQVGKIEGLITTKPVDDANVVYSFTFYDPFVLTLQGAEWLTPKLWSHLGDVPYPSDPDMIAQRMPSILGNIPANPAEWRPTVKRLLTDYGNAKWNRERIATRVKKLVDWNESHGGGLKIWCAEFGCYQRTIGPEDRYRYIKDLREVFEENGIGWAYWSYNETLTVMTTDRQPFGPARFQTADRKMLEALLGNPSE